MRDAGCDFEHQHSARATAGGGGEKEMVRGQRLCLPPALLSGLKTNSIRGCGCTAVEKQQLEVTAY